MAQLREPEELSTSADTQLVARAPKKHSRRWHRVLTGNNLNLLEGRGGRATEQGQGDITRVGGVVVPFDVVGRASSQGLLVTRLDDGIEPSGLGNNSAGEGKNGGNSETHLGGWRGKFDCGETKRFERSGFQDVKKKEIKKAQRSSNE